MTSNSEQYFVFYRFLVLIGPLYCMLVLYVSALRLIWHPNPFVLSLLLHQRM